MYLAYLRHADGYHVKKAKPTVGPVNIRLAIRTLRQLYGQTIAREFGPLRLKAVRPATDEAGICEGEIDRRVGRLVRVFDWGISEEMVSPSVRQSVPGFRRGRAFAWESKPVRPAPEADIRAIRAPDPTGLWRSAHLTMRPPNAKLLCNHLRKIIRERPGTASSFHFASGSEFLGSGLLPRGS